MPIRYDLKIGFDTQDLEFANGDFQVHQSDEQHIRDIVNSGPGWWKEFPTLGCDAIKYVNSPETAFQFLSRKMLIELTNDGYFVNNPLIFFDNEGKLSINPNTTIIP